MEEWRRELGLLGPGGVPASRNGPGAPSWDSRAHKEVLQAALGDFLASVCEMLAPTEPSTPPPRPRVFELAPGVWWPRYKRETGEVDWFVLSFADPPASFDRRLRVGDGRVYCVSYYGDRQDAAEFFLEKCGSKPRLVLRTLRRIQAAAAWCRARAEGRKRMAEEILRQQAASVQALEAERTLLGLRKL